MSQPTSSPAKKLKSWLRIGKKTQGGQSGQSGQTGQTGQRGQGGDGSDDSNDPRSTPESSKRKRTGEVDPKTTHKRTRSSPDLPETPRTARMYTNNALSNINTDRISILYITPPREKIDRYQATGAQFEEWMANTNTAGPACPVIQSTLTLDTLIQGNPPQKPEFNNYKAVGSQLMYPLTNIAL
ncbi:hypothetical protein ACN38_g11096 [Penicillium nordicum]|uniref:Uncharacterized protein n=1 Tax=Penicillium nordicum TaxID=229535 RepID=A0A0M9WBF3_9EURO|nr:hypothetical protein ACN38_g11096 [Penicillium nordicum]